LKTLQAEPYRLLFPLGTASAVIGLGLWIPYYFWPEAFPYPGQAHAVIQIHAFMLCFIFGFLTTMLPKILGVKPLDPFSFLAFPVLLVGIIGASLAGAPLLAQSMHLLILMNFIGFIIRRYPTRKSNPPTAFLFIAVAMLTDVIGTLAKIAALTGNLGDNIVGPTLRAGSILQFQAFPLLLILGVGGFLLPKLFANGPVDPKSLQANARFNARMPILVCLLFITSYGIEILSLFKGYGNIGLQIAYALRGLVWTWFIFMDIRIHKIPGILPPYLKMARIALYAMGLALFLPVVSPSFILAWEHIIFLGGLMPLTLAIASRVLAAHAGRMDLLALHGGKIWIYGILLILSTVTRVATEIWPGGRAMHLAIAAILALSALFIWGKIYIRLSKTYPGR
jgi:uncharacterized protein involved in response to NO